MSSGLQEEAEAEVRRLRAIAAASEKVSGGCILNEDDIEIDGDAKVSEGSDAGCWVQAWLWLTDEELDDE